MPPTRRRTDPIEGQSALWPAPVAEPAPAADELAEPPAELGTAEVIASWVTWCTAQGGIRPPSRIIARIGREVRQLLVDGVPDHHIRRALALWSARGNLSPVALPALVNELANARPDIVAAYASRKRQAEQPSALRTKLDRLEQLRADHRRLEALGDSGTRMAIGGSDAHVG